MMQVARPRWVESRLKGTGGLEDAVLSRDRGHVRFCSRIGFIGGNGKAEIGREVEAVRLTLRLYVETAPIPF